MSAAISKECLFFYETLDRPYNTSFFGEYIDQFLDNLDQEGKENQIIIMDNVRFHRVEEFRQKIDSRGPTLEFLLLYSPFLNPIEEVFSKWKGIVKQKVCLNEDQLIKSTRKASKKINKSIVLRTFSI